MIPSATASAAPALTPRNPGSATGLWVTPCMSDARQAERHADDDGDQRPRQPELRDDELRAGAVGRGKRPDDARHVEVRGAQPQAEDRQRHDDQRAKAQPGKAAGRAAEQMGSGGDR